MTTSLDQQIRNHPRDWHGNLYVYPVISRRSGGLSIGVNLNPDTACNFDCIYCQVDRSAAPRVRHVDPEKLHDELAGLLDGIRAGGFFDDPAFADVPAEFRVIKDIAFSGDGEPTTCKNLRECVDLVAALKRETCRPETRLVLITDACYLKRSEVEAALTILDANGGEIWAKLDAGTEDYYETVNRPNFPLRHVIENITAAASVRPVVIQSLFMRIHGRPADAAELSAYVERLLEITAAGGRIDRVQVYTIARTPAESYVTPLSNEDVDGIVQLVRDRTNLRADAYYGAA
ncbi:MAG: radical SAM protein [Phycisphaerae bacterium]